MIRLLYPWNGYPTGTILSNVDANTELALVRGGIAVTDLSTGSQSMTQAAFEQFPAPFVIAQTGSPVIVLSSGSITATGSMAGMTPLPYVPIGVVKVYVAASAGLTAGLMYARFTTTGACQLFTDPAGTITPTGLTAGAYTAPTTYVPLATVPVPGNLMGANGALRITVPWQFTSSANNKGCTVQLNGTTVSSTALTATSAQQTIIMVRNQGNPFSQILMATNNNFGTGATTTAVSQVTVDTTQQMLITFIGGHTLAADNFALEGYTVEVLPAP